ncbi:MAG: hypothetical protein J6B96_02625 [Agathobacter sp.]|nr:hypothetical protein [Agathobacter sp.]
MKKLIEARILLLSPMGKITAPVQIYYDESDVADTLVEINLTYNNTLYQGNGIDYLWIDAFADLQRKLPDDIKLACCMTCCHGNMCPYGNRENELFCTKDLIITTKDDMHKLFDETDPFVERVVASLDYCNDFVYQNDDCYTYNDYLYHLRKKQ